MKSASLFRLIALSLLAGLWIYGIYSVSTGDKQWDFKTYYYAAAAHQRGLDAYDNTATEQIAGTPIKLSYVYPPLTLWFFRAFTFFDFAAAYQIFLFLKVLLLVGICLLWSRYLFKGEDPLLVYWFATMAFASTIYWDFFAGNIGIFEQFLFWIAIVAMLRGKLLLYCSAIVMISFFKLTFIFFLVLPLLDRQRNAIRFVTVAFVAFCAYLFANYILETRDFQVFLSILGALDERGELYNHSALAIIRDIFDRGAAAGFFSSVSGVVPSALYLLVVLFIVAISWSAFRKNSAQRSGGEMLESIYLACLTYSLIMPRMKSYSFILVIPASYYVIKNCVKPQAFVYLLILLSLTKWTPLPVPDVIRFLWWYYPWLCALLVWALYVKYLGDGRSRST